MEKSLPLYPVFDLAEPASANESPKSSGSSEVSQQENVKRKRRRKKGKGGASQNAAQSALADASSEPEDEAVAGDTASSPPRPAQQTRPKLDPESVAKLAWKIYLAEVSEEGVALIGDSDAKELTRRCFRLAEIFMEEQARRR